MSEDSDAADFENLRKVVEAIDEMTDEDQLQGPTVEEVSEELDVSKTTVNRWVDWDYLHAVRTAGLIPKKDRNIGDYMAVYDKLNSAGGKITKKAVQEDSPVSPLGHTDKSITHNQAREKLGLDPNLGFADYAPKKIYGEDGENFEHQLRGIILKFLDENNRLPSTSELNGEINFPEDETIQESKERSGLYAEPVRVNSPNYGLMSADRENEVLEFWVNEYLEEDWSQYEDSEVEPIMKMRMTMEDINESELNAVAEKYSKWVDFSQY